VFLRFCGEHGWTTLKPAAIVSPEVRGAPVIPFTDAQMVKILDACDVYEKLPCVKIPIKIFVLASRHAGLRIHDVVTLERKMVDGDTLQRQTEKTGTVVRVPLHPDCVTALKKLPENSPYFFWSGSGESRTRVNNFQVVLRKVFKLASIKGHHHQFSHTFARALLESGVLIERVSRLMGHSDSRVTSQTYSAWIRERQDAAESDVRRSWVETKGS
jgi:integrase